VRLERRDVTCLWSADFLVRVLVVGGTLGDGGFMPGRGP
jgi:hypothetical protein